MSEKVLLTRINGHLGRAVSTHGICHAEVPSVDVAVSGSVDAKACVVPDKAVVGNFLENNRTEGC